MCSFEQALQNYKQSSFQRPRRTKTLPASACAENPLKRVSASGLTHRQFDQMILRCRRALRSHRFKARSADRERAEGDRGGIFATLETLGELLRVAPSEKRGKIAALMAAYQDTPTELENYTDELGSEMVGRACE
jgi:hypothetical protein